MKKQYYFVILFLFGIIIFNFNFTFVVASGEEVDDGIDDNFEEINKRDIEISFNGNKIELESIRRTDQNKDEIRTNIVYDGNGIKINLSYRSNLEAECELGFGILFREITEFIDINKDGFYDPGIDQPIKNVSLNDFQPIFYEKSNISTDSALHYLKIQTINNTFTFHIYFVEEFAIIENSLVAPTQTKINIEINYDFFNESSQIALNTRLDSQGDYEKEEETEDEREGYAEDEKGVITSMNNFTGFFTWENNATIDGISKKVYASEVMVDKYNETEEMIYISYPNGEHIYHDPKIGIEGLLKPIGVLISPIDIIILALIIGAVSISAAYLAYHYSTIKPQKKKVERDREEYFNGRFDDKEFRESYTGRSPLQIFLQEGSTEKLSQMGNLNITVLTEDFIKAINQFDWERNEKNEFIREMLAFSPIERQLILKEMIEKSKRNMSF